MALHSGMKHGKLDRRPGDPSVPFQDKYWLGGTLAETVGCVALPDDNEWNMFDNDKYEDCTCAAAAHLIMAWTARTERFERITTPQVLDSYSNITGFDQETGTPDKGAVVFDVLKYWHNKGIAGHRIEGFTEVVVDPDITKAQRINADHLKIIVGSFCGAYLGLQLPKSAMDQAIWGEPQQSDGPQQDNAYGSWTGHAVCVVGYDPQYLTVITWGQKKQMTWEFLQKYADEVYAILSDDYLESGATPNGIDIAVLERDLETLKEALSQAMNSPVAVVIAH